MDASLRVVDFWKFLVLRNPSFEAVRQAPGSLWLSLRLFMLAGLIGTIGILTTGLAEAQRVTVADRLSAGAVSLDGAAENRLLRWTPRLASAMTIAADRMRQAAAAIEAVQPPLGSAASESLRAVGVWVSQPLLSLTGWLTVFLPLLVAARLLGGRGSLREQVSLGLLAFLPQALLFLSSFHPEPGTAGASVAAMLRVGAAVWSLAIWLTASAVANRYSRVQAAKVLVATIAALVLLTAISGWLLDLVSGALLSVLL